MSKLLNNFFKPLQKGGLKIILSLIAIVKHFNWEVIVEGIANNQTHQFIKQIKVAYGQGCFFEKPSDMNDILARYKT